MRGGALAAALAVALAGCGGEPPVPEQHAVRELLERYEQRFEVLDVNGLARLYTEDALLLPPGERRIGGRERIARFWQGGMGPGVVFEPIVVAQGPNQGFAAGTYSSPTDTGKFMIGAVLDDDGEWRIAADIWNGNIDTWSAPPATEPSADGGRQSETSETE